MADEALLRAVGISKIFPGTVALDNVSFNAYAGMVNILVGENGAGKSTLMKIISGAEQPSDGSLALDGRPVRFRGPIEAQAHGIATIYQEIDLCRNLSIADNIFLSREIAPRGLIDYRHQKRVASELLERLEHPMDPSKLVGELGVSAQQIVAVAKAIAQNVRVLIMDEPTSALTGHEVEILFRIVRDLRSRGVAIIYISHRLEEVIQVGDVITVLRDGRVRAEAKVKEINVDWIIDKMVGKTLSVGTDRMLQEDSPELLAVRHLKLRRSEGGHSVDDVSFAVRAGEIVGLYGLLGAGRTELLECLIGLQEDSEGEILVGGVSVPAGSSVEDRISRGLILVPEDRQAAGIVPTLSVAENMLLASLRDFTRGGFLPRRAGDAAIQAMVKGLAIRISSTRQAITSLSGGNQQKVVLAKALLTKPKVLLMDEPTRGIDVNAKSEVFAIMNRFATEGISILFTSSELKEIVAQSDRVLVMSRGQITGEFFRGRYDEADLVAASARGRSGDN